MVNKEEQFEVSEEVKDLLEVMSLVQRAERLFEQWESKNRKENSGNADEVLENFFELKDSLNGQLNVLL